MITTSIWRYSRSVSASALRSSAENFILNSAENFSTTIMPRAYCPDLSLTAKIRMLLKIRDKVEIIIAINADDIEKNKLRGDLGISYDDDVLRLTDIFRGLGFYVGSVVITRYARSARGGQIQKAPQRSSE